MAGVIRASPKNSAAPTMPSITTNAVLSPVALRASAIRVSVPPSPLLSARSSTMTYLNVTMKISAHRMSDNTPYTAAAVGT